MTSDWSPQRAKIDIDLHNMMMSWSGMMLLKTFDKLGMKIGVEETQHFLSFIVLVANPILPSDFLRNKVEKGRK